MQKSAWVLVGVFYPLVVSFAVLLLAVAQLRSSAGTNYDLWRLNYKSTVELSKLLAEKATKIQLSIDSNADDVTFSNYCLAKLKNATSTPAPPPTTQSVTTNTVVAAAGESNATGPIPAIKVGSISCGKLAGDALCNCRGVAGSTFYVTSGTTKEKGFETQLAENQTMITATQNLLNDLIHGHQDFLAFVEMENSGRWYVNVIATVPYDLLILLMVMFMGALGGMVRLLRDYGDKQRDDPNPKDYFFIPLIGMVVAIGGYVLAKTGLLLLSSAKEDASLSPFVIGLVGIVSGLMAREVIDAIGRAGRKMMEGRGTDPNKAQDGLKSNPA